MATPSNGTSLSPPPPPPPSFDGTAEAEKEEGSDAVAVSPPKPLNPIFHILLLAIHKSRSSPLRVLRRDYTAVILVFEAIEAMWAAHVDWKTAGELSLFRFAFPAPITASQLESGDFEVAEDRDFDETLTTDLETWDWYNTPRLPPDDELVPVHINMMPIEMGVFDSLPPICARYQAVINRCLRHCPDEFGCVGYLTIHEDFVPAGASQRRPGIHCESPGIVMPDLNGNWTDGIIKMPVRWGNGGLYGEDDYDDDPVPDGTFCIAGPRVRGGIFMGSSVDDSTRVWDCTIAHLQEVVADRLGSLEHLRGVLASPADAAPRSRPSARLLPPPPSHTSRLLSRGEMVWITDRTPHESVPLPSTPAADGSSGSTFRQYFRLVTSDCAVWYARHSTRNETGVEPPKCVKVIGEDKFAAAGVGGDDGAKKQMKKKDKDKAGGSAGEGSGPRMTNRAMPSSDYLTRTWAEKKKEYQARLASANPGLPPKKT